MKGDIHIAVWIVGKESGEWYGWHNANEIGGNHNHQHVGQIMTFLFVRIELSIVSLGMCKGLNKSKIQLKDHADGNDTNEKTIKEQRHC